MIYDAAGRPIDEADSKKPDIRRLTIWEPTDRLDTDASRGLTPTRLDSIFRSANAGDPRDQARLAEELCEKDGDIVAHLQTRRLAVMGLDWCVEAADEDDTSAVAIAEEAEGMLRRIGTQRWANDADGMDFSGLLEELLGSLLPGYSMAEILWAAGGKDIEGFVAVARRHIAFTQSRSPLIVSRMNSAGDPLALHKFVWHCQPTASGDATRGGLIRPLGWIHLFTQTGTKDLLRFVEKFGMPFVSARIDESSWDKDRLTIAKLIKNFGSDGGACFSKAVELEMLEGAQSAGDVYFRLLEHFGTVKTKIILGQTATSGDAGGFSKGQAQDNVRKDLLQADCKALEKTVRNWILAPWTMFTHGPDAPVPAFRFRLEEPEDFEANSKVILSLDQAGWEAEAEDVESKCGIRVTRKIAPSLEPGAPGGESLAMSDRNQKTRRDAARLKLAAAEKAQEELIRNALAAVTGDQAALRDWLGPLQDAIAEALAGLPEDEGDSRTMAEFQARLSAILESMPALYKRLDTRAIEEHLARAMFAADCNGRVAAAAR